MNTQAPVNALDWLTSIPNPAQQTIKAIYCREMGDDRVVMEHNGRQRTILYDGGTTGGLIAFLNAQPPTTQYRFYSDQINLNRQQFEAELQRRATAKSTIAPVAAINAKRGTRDCRRSVD